ncbi:MAG: enoyl-CoA hydratase/isomerase family protein [Deltaproteobacteria bacterium]|nr:enoyl-CoA hydratase/isomerase family protein [Deltaproteobacteria bacterium]
MSQHVLVTTAERITTIRIDRPEKRNAITLEMYGALRGALAAASAARDVRAIVIAGSPTCFTAGNDLNDFVRANQGGAGDLGAPFGFLHALATLEKPLIAAVHGVAIGIGTTLLLHCDLVFAGPSARFKTPFVDLGLVPEAGSSLLLPALIGERRAAQMLLLGETIDAPTGLAWGLVNEVDADSDARARAAAIRIAASSPSAVRATKGLVRRPSRAHVLEAMRIEGEAFTERLRSPEAMEALQAAMMKRPADFSKF